MNQVISIRVPEETRKEMKNSGGLSTGTRRSGILFKKRSMTKKRMMSLASVSDLLKKNPAVPSGSAAKLVRADRDRH